MTTKWQSSTGELPARWWSTEDARWYEWSEDGEHCFVYLARYLPIPGSPWPEGEYLDGTRRGDWRFWVKRDPWTKVPWAKCLTKKQAVRRGIPPLLSDVHVRDRRRDACSRCGTFGQDVARTGAPCAA